MTNENEIITNEAIQGTPFRIVGNPSQGYCITIGTYKLTEPTETINEAKDQLHLQEWNIIANMIVIILETHQRIIKQPEKNTSDEPGPYEQTR